LLRKYKKVLCALSAMIEDQGVKVRIIRFFSNTWISNLLLCVLLLSVVVPISSKAEDPNFLTISAGWFDFNRQKDPGAEFRVEYRSAQKFWQFKPFLTLAGVSNAMTFIGAGVLLDIYWGPRWVTTPSFAPTLWRGATDDLDLGHVIEFRSQLEVAYRFDDRSRLGLSISHYSNASLGDDNPGTESFMINYSIPFEKLFN